MPAGRDHGFSGIRVSLPFEFHAGGIDHLSVRSAAGFNLCPAAHRTVNSLRAAVSMGKCSCGGSIIFSPVKYRCQISAYRDPVNNATGHEIRRAGRDTCDSKPDAFLVRLDLDDMGISAACAGGRIECIVSIIHLCCDQILPAVCDLRRISHLDVARDRAAGGFAVSCRTEDLHFVSCAAAVSAAVKDILTVPVEVQVPSGGSIAQLKCTFLASGY